jgi:hypothetical protein
LFVALKASSEVASVPPMSWLCSAMKTSAMSSPRPSNHAIGPAAVVPARLALTQRARSATA